MDPKAQEKKALRKALLDARANLPDRLHRAELLLRVMRVWLVGRADTTIGAYWPIKGEFDPLPALHRWKEDGELNDIAQRRRIALPVVNKAHKTMTAWATALAAIGWATAAVFMTGCWPAWSRAPIP